MQSLNSFSARNEAIVDQQFRTLGLSAGNDTLATIKLVEYSPDYVSYQTKSSVSQLAVFSEVYYDKGWRLEIDGIKRPYLRADYLLRAAQIPAGNHQITFIFQPISYWFGEYISKAGSILLVLLLVGTVFEGKIRNYRSEKRN